MRASVLIIAALAAVASSPALAAPPVPVDTEADAQAMTQEAMRVLNDPRSEQTIGQAMRVLTDTLLNLKVGELKAVVDGRAISEADKNMTVRDLARRNDPNFEPKLRAQMDRAQPMIREKAKALVAALPQLMKSAESMGQAMERLSANLPDPTYPKR